MEHKRAWAVRKLAGPPRRAHGSCQGSGWEDQGVWLYIALSLGVGDQTRCLDIGEFKGTRSSLESCQNCPPENQVPWSRVSKESP